MQRVAVLSPGTQAKEEITLKPLFDRMREPGWVEGQNIADDRMEKLHKLAAELVARKPEVFYAAATPAALAAKQATQTIPIVFGAASDLVGTALVTSLARPGGNVTGMSNINVSLSAKRVEMLREILPGAKRIGLLGGSTDRIMNLEQQALAPVAASFGLTIIVAQAANPVEFDIAVAKLIAERVDAIYGGGSPTVLNLRGRLIELANQKRIPVIGGGQSAYAGALFTYSGSFVDRSRRSAILMDKILKGTKPADLPVEQPTLFELVVNLKAAKALGITVPPSILLGADRVIE